MTNQVLVNLGFFVIAEVVWWVICWYLFRKEFKDLGK